MFCPDELYSLWLECWDLNPKNRPSFDYIIRYICEYIVEKDPSDRRIRMLLRRHDRMDRFFIGSRGGLTQTRI